AELQFGHGSPPWRTMARLGTRYHGSQASIRPRLTAVENRVGRHWTETWECPSIRPRLTAVENPPWSCRSAHRRRYPSIRPRLTPVENHKDGPIRRFQRHHLQFGHGSPPWRTPKGPFKNTPATLLQFGHGSPPWRTGASCPLVGLVHAPSI